MPYLHDPHVQARAADAARSQGLLERIERQLTPGDPIAVLPYAGFREFARTGNRTNYERLLQRRSGQIELAAMGCYLGMDLTDYLQDLLWAECESTWWIMPAHERPGGSIDLRAAMCACNYALILELLGERIEAEVRQRLLTEIRRRVLREYLDAGRQHWWKTCTNNWNAVCNGSIALAAMLIEKDPSKLAETIESVLEALPAFLEGFTADGGCTEGASYWRFGFGWYVRFAAALYDLTGGQVNIMAGERIESICRYPLAVCIRPGQELSFADAHPGFLSPATAVHINRFHDVPELFGLCRLTGDGRLRVDCLTDLLLYDGQPRDPLADRKDAFLPDLGVAEVRAGEVTLGAKGGHNGEHHNHNDVGSFLLHRGGSVFLTDLGAPIYSRRTFSPQRYQSVFCNSRGHSVPVIDGALQAEGPQFAGTIAAEGLNGDRTKSLRIDMARAYDLPHLERLTRRIDLPPGGAEVLIADTFAFSRAPQSVEEAFITTLPAEATADGRSVAIRSEADGVARLTAPDVQGRFAVAELPAESAESRTGELIRRISFVPDRLEREMTLSFAVRFG